VLPLAGGKCPSCHQDTASPPKSAADRTAIVVDEFSQLPEFCCTCTQPTRRKVRLSQSYQSRGETAISSDEDGGFGARVISRIIFGGLLTRLFAAVTASPGGAQSTTTKVVIHMRQCRPCSQQQPLEPLGVNFDHGTMRLPVHRAFAEAFSAVNERSPT